MLDNHIAAFHTEPCVGAERAFGERGDETGASAYLAFLLTIVSFTRPLVKSCLCKDDTQQRSRTESKTGKVAERIIQSLLLPIITISTATSSPDTTHLNVHQWRSPLGKPVRRRIPARNTKFVRLHGCWEARFCLFSFFSGSPLPARGTIALANTVGQKLPVL